MSIKPMSLLLLEDDEYQCNLFKKYVESRDDLQLIGVTNSSTKALELVKSYSPEAIIVDIELHNGQGSGIEFLIDLKKLTTDFRPLVVVTTNSESKILYDQLHSEGVDLIFCKNQVDYSPKIVITPIIAMRKSLYKCNKLNSKIQNFNIESKYEQKINIENKINYELDLIGIASHLNGRKYLYDSILYLLENGENPDKESVFNYLANKYKKTSSAISRVIQTSINYAWRTSCPDDLEMHYTAKISYKTGVPSPTELIYYYYNKIKKLI